jgi:hypothetical protein
MGTDTLVEIWVEGKLRGICVSQEAIGAYLGFDQAAGMSDRDRCEFVRAHLPLVITAVKDRLRTSPGADELKIDAGQLPRPDGRGGNRRKGERRKAERRKADSLKTDLPLGERRRGERRKVDRRRPDRSDG